MSMRRRDPGRVSEAQDVRIRDGLRRLWPWSKLPDPPAVKEQAIAERRHEQAHRDADQLAGVVFQAGMGAGIAGLLGVLALDISTTGRIVFGLLSFGAVLAATWAALAIIPSGDLEIGTAAEKKTQDVRSALFA